MAIDIQTVDARARGLRPSREAAGIGPLGGPQGWAGWAGRAIGPELGPAPG